MSDVADAVEAIRSGEFVLLHDSKKRENEIDLVIAAEFITPEHIARMRKDAGGLICLAIRNDLAEKLGLVYMHDILRMLRETNPVLAKLSDQASPYGDHPAFSVAVNHRETYTGVTDQDRALTIRELGRLCSKSLRGHETRQEFSRSFRAPGHVPILIASRGLLDQRLGHTELAVYLTQLAGLTPVVTICEMLDDTTHKALSVESATEYSEKNQLVMLEGKDLQVHFAKVH